MTATLKVFRLLLLLQSLQINFDAMGQTSNSNNAAVQAAIDKCYREFWAKQSVINDELRTCRDNASGNTVAWNNCFTVKQSKTQANAAIHDACIHAAQKNVLPSPQSPGGGQPTGLTFAGTPEQQEAARKREEEALRKQRTAAAIGTIANGAAQLLGDLGAQRSEEFNKKLDESRRNIDAVNGRGSTQFQPTDDKGAMQNAKLNNESMDEIGPGQEEDETESVSEDKEINRLTKLTDEQFEKERQRFIERNKDRPADDTPNYDLETSRLAEAEQAIRRRNAANGSEETPNEAAKKPTATDFTSEVKDFLNSIKSKNPLDYTDEEIAKLAYLGYTASSGAQTVIGGLLHTGGGVLGKVAGPLLGVGAVNDQLQVTNPFLKNWQNQKSKK